MKKHINTALLLLTVLATITGCKKQDFAGEQQAAATLRMAGDYIRNNSSFSILAAALEKTGLMDSLNNSAVQYTVFAPDDNAFHIDSILTPADLGRFSVDSLRFLLKNHLMQRKLFSSDIPFSLDNLYPNLNGLNLYISGSQVGGIANYAVSGVQMKKIQTATSGGSVFDVPLINGVIHVMSRVIKYYNGTVQDFVGSRKDLTDFTAGLKKFNCWDSLRLAGPYTVFAPVNIAFDTNHISLDSINRMDPAVLQTVLFRGYYANPHHIFLTDLGMVTNDDLAVGNGYQLEISSSVPAGADLLNPTGDPLGPLKTQPYPSQRVSPFVDANSTDYLCSNGIVHLLAQLMVLPGDVPK